MQRLARLSTLNTRQLGGVRTLIQHSGRHSMRPPTRKPDPLATSSSAQTTVLPDNTTFVHRPPPSAPGPFSLTTAPASALLRPATRLTSSTSARLPPTTRTDRPPSAGRVSQAVIKTIIERRKEAPEKWTRKALAKVYGVTQSFVGMVAPSAKSYRREAGKKMEAVHEAKRAKWGERKKMSMDIRKKRKEFW